MRSPLSFAAGLMLLAGCHAGSPSVAQQPSADPAMPAVVRLATVPLRIRTADGARDFTVEVARTPEEQSRGLMFRTEVPRGEGMIFPMAPPRPASFWMMNTLVPLDMLFIRADGTIARIAANTTPRSLATVDSGEPVAAVLELAGGEAARLGIATGDRVDWKDQSAR